MFKKVNSILAVLIGLSILLSACATPTPITIIQTRDVEKTVSVVTTQVVEVTSTPKPRAAGEKTLIVWWSHWANEPSKREVIETIVSDYETANPDVDIVLTWWDKNPMRDAVQSTMTAGEGAPDITTFDTEMTEWVKAGWLLDLSDVLPWDNFIDAAYNDGTYPGIQGHYKYNIGFRVDMLLYNKEIFNELGIQVPEDYQFTQSEFVDVVETCRAGGYAGVANGIGNRPFTARFLLEDALVNLVGIEEFGRYLRGEQSWDTPQVRQVLTWVDQLTKAGIWPDSFSTLTIDELHVYFHTQRKACMLNIPTYYTGRAFKAEKEGGQSPDFQFGMLRYPEMDGALYNNTLRGGFESGYSVTATSRHPDIAKDILVFASQPKYGALWVAKTNSPTSIKYDPVEDGVEGLGPNPYQWYWDEFYTVYGPLDVGTTNESKCGDFEDAQKTALNEGLPLGLISVDEAIQMIDAKRCK